MHSERTIRLTIAVLTYRRPLDIVAVLPLLSEQARSIPDDVAVRILVIDNDPLGGAEIAVRAAAQRTTVRIDYVSEPVPGISAARNRALDESLHSDLLVFIDDDERPTTGWLPALLALQRDRGATAVVGPVVSSFEIEPDEWVRAGRFFDRRRLPTGTKVQVAATNNLLLDLRAVRAHGIRFDHAFGITGGDDTMFTRTLVRAGGSIVWCDEAVVVDVVPASRVTRDWVVRRALSSGNSWSLVAMRLSPRLIDKLREAGRLNAKGLVRLVGGATRAALGSLTGSAPHQARGVRTAARGAGMVLGAWGYRYLEYRR